MNNTNGSMVGLKESSFFDCISAQEPVELFELAKAFQEDDSPHKVNLSIGAYRNEEGKHWVLPVVRKVEKELGLDETLSHEYLGILGLQTFSKAAQIFLLGEDCPAIKENRILGIQTLSGTGALRVGAEFLVKVCNRKTFYMSDLSWPSHHIVFPYAGFQEIRRYRYWNPSSRNLDIQGMLEDLSAAPEESIVVLHVCGHNPTGVDPDADQWKQIADVMERRSHFPFFDCAYQGFVSGDWEKDAWPVRHFVERGFELFCAQSFAKNFGLYGERIGNLVIVFNNTAPIANVRSQFTYIIRGNYSNPPAYGARIVERILNSPQLFNEWKVCIKQITERIHKMRILLRERLEELNTPGTWNHITEHRGMYSFTGITGIKTEYLRNLYHIYMPKVGRMNISGLNLSNIDYVAKAIKDVIMKCNNDN